MGFELDKFVSWFKGRHLLDQWYEYLELEYTNTGSISIFLTTGTLWGSFARWLWIVDHQDCQLKVRGLR